MRIINLGWFGFWILLATAIGCGTYCYLKVPPNALRSVMVATQEERLVRNLQDPLAMRLYALKFALKEYPAQTTPDAYKEVIVAVVKQWAEEVSTLKEQSYHAKAADSQWDASKLPLNKDQKDALLDVSGRFDVDVMGGGK